MTQPFYKIIPFVVMTLVVLAFRLTDLIKSKPGPLLYVVLAELYLAMFFAYVLRAGIAAVLMVLLAGATASFAGRHDEHPFGPKVFVLSAVVLAIVAELVSRYAPEHLHDVLLLLWFRSFSYPLRGLVWLSYFGIGYGASVTLRGRVVRAV